MTDGSKSRENHQEVWYVKRREFHDTARSQRLQRRLAPEVRENLKNKQPAAKLSQLAKSLQSRDTS